MSMSPLGHLSADKLGSSICKSIGCLGMGIVSGPNNSGQKELLVSRIKSFFKQNNFVVENKLRTTLSYFIVLGTGYRRSTRWFHTFDRLSRMTQRTPYEVC